jgi:hypothetical protein
MNLECRYDIFRQIAQDNYRWEVLLPADPNYLYSKKASNVSSSHNGGDGDHSSGATASTSASTKSTLTAEQRVAVR